MAAKIAIATIVIAAILGACAAFAQEAQVPPIVIRSLESEPVGRATIYAGRCEEDDISVRVEDEDPMAPRVSVTRGEIHRSFDLGEPFVRDLFLGHRYSLIELSCYGDGLKLLALLHASRDDVPMYFIGSVYFDGHLNVAQYDGMGIDPPTVVERFDLNYYDRLLSCRATSQDRAAIRDCVRRQSAD